MSVTYSQTSLSTADIQQRIARLYDHLYANAPVRTPAGIAAEVGKVLRAAMFMERLQSPMFSDDLAIQSPAFEFSRSDTRRLERAEDALYVQVAGEVRSQFRAMNIEWKLYESDTQILLADADIAYTCAQLNSVVVSDKHRDVFGDALEIFRGQWAKRASGQFFTDQRVTSLSMTLLDFDPRKGDDLVDLCSGTGGFLLAGINHIYRLLEQDNGVADEKEVVLLASQSLRGREVDAEVCEIANGTISARLGRFAHTFVQTGDSLRPLETVGNADIRYDSHLCAATNPPFGTKITIKDDAILRNYVLASGNGRVASRAPDTLFIEQNVRILKPGVGRLAIVVPYQILSGPQATFIREWILKNTEVLAVIDLPADTFQPHTGTKASLLLVKRRKKPLKNFENIKKEDTQVFMAAPRWIGHDRRGNPIYKRLADGSFTGEILSDFQEVEAAFRAFKRGENPTLTYDKAFTIKLSDVFSDPMLRMNVSFHKASDLDISRRLLAPLSSSSASDETRTSQLDDAWRYVKLKDVVKRIFYPGRFKRHYVDYYSEAIPFLGGANISQLMVTTDKWLRHDNPHLDELRVRSGWLLITRSGSTGIISTVPQTWDGYAMSEHIIRIIPDDSKLDSAYLHAFLRTAYAQATLKKGVFGSVIDEITPEFVGSIEIPIPASAERLDHIATKCRMAEDARNTAMFMLTEAVEDINHLLD